MIRAGDYAEAVKVYRDTVTFCEQIYDDHHRTVGITKARMAEPLMLMNDLAQAEIVLRKALDIFRQEDRNLANRVHTVQDLLAVLDLLDRNTEAAELCRQELSFARHLTDSPESGEYLVAVLQQTAQADEALGMLGPRRGPLRRLRDFKRRYTARTTERSRICFGNKHGWSSRRASSINTSRPVSACWTRSLTVPSPSGC